MENSNKVIGIIEDHTRVTDTIDMICCAIENGTDMPNFIPVCNDTILSDQLSKICETITTLRKKLL
jgi:hypothetical protein